MSEQTQVFDRTPQGAPNPGEALPFTPEQYEQRSGLQIIQSAVLHTEAPDYRNQAQAEKSWQTAKQKGQTYNLEPEEYMKRAMQNQDRVAVGPKSAVLIDGVGSLLNSAEAAEAGVNKFMRLTDWVSDEAEESKLPWIMSHVRQSVRECDQEAGGADGVLVGLHLRGEYVDVVNAGDAQIFMMPLDDKSCATRLNTLQEHPTKNMVMNFLSSNQDPEAIKRRVQADLRNRSDLSEALRERAFMSEEEWYESESGARMAVEQLYALYEDEYKSVHIAEPTRFVGASDGINLTAADPDKLDEIMRLPDANECAAELEQLFGVEDDRSIFVVDVAPAKATAQQDESQFVPGREDETRAPEVPDDEKSGQETKLPQWLESIPGSTDYYCNGILKELNIPNTGEWYDRQEVMDRIEADLQVAEEAFSDLLARLHNRGMWRGHSKKYDRVGHEYATVLGAYNAVMGLRLEDDLRARYPGITDEAVAAEVNASLMLLMVGGRNKYTGNTERGEVQALNDKIARKRLLIEGWREDANGRLRPPQGGVQGFVYDFQKMWRRWGSEGWKGRGKQVGTMAGIFGAGGAALALSLPAAVVGTAGVLHVATAAGIGARLSRGLITAKAQRGTKLSEVARQKQNRAARLTAEALRKQHAAHPVGKVALGVLVEEQFRSAHTDSLANTGRTLLAATTALGGSVLGTLTHMGIDHFFNGGHHPTPQGRGGRSGSHSPKTGERPRHTSKPSHRPTHTPRSSDPRPSTGPTHEPQPKHPGHGTGPGQKPGSGDYTTPPRSQVQLHVEGPNQTMSDVINNANGSFSDNWQHMTDAAHNAQQAHQLRIIHMQNDRFYYEVLNSKGEWTDDTTAVARTLSKFSKGKFALAA